MITVLPCDRLSWTSPLTIIAGVNSLILEAIEEMWTTPSTCPTKFALVVTLGVVS